MHEIFLSFQRCAQNSRILGLSVIRKSPGLTPSPSLLGRHGPLAPPPRSGSALHLEPGAPPAAAPAPPPARRPCQAHPGTPRPRPKTRNGEQGLLPPVSKYSAWGKFKKLNLSPRVLLNKGLFMGERGVSLGGRWLEKSLKRPLPLKRGGLWLPPALPQNRPF